MPHYKIPNNPSPHFLSEEDIKNGGESYLPLGFKKISDAQATKMQIALIPKPTDVEVKAERNGRLTACDWVDTLSAKSRLGDDIFQAWMDYRQALRDVTKQKGFPESVIWPISPDT